MQPRRAGKNLTQAVQNSFERGLVGKAGRIQQSSIAVFGVPHDASALVRAALKCRRESSTARTERPDRDARRVVPLACELRKQNRTHLTNASAESGRRQGEASQEGFQRYVSCLAEHRLPKTKLLKPSKTATCGRAANLVWAGLRVLSVPVPREPGLI
jgi:hypothetical protein